MHVRCCGATACNPSVSAGRASIMMTAREMVRRVTPPMNAPAPISANAPGSTHAHGLGGRNTPGGALQAAKTGSSVSAGPPRSARTRPGPPTPTGWAAGTRRGAPCKRPKQAALSVPARPDQRERAQVHPRPRAGRQEHAGGRPAH